MITSLPNLLTLSRIAVIPVLVALFYVDGAPARWLACALFTAACITDYFDGYLARIWRQDSDFGRFLDPIADKLLVASTLFMLVAMEHVSGLGILPALVILCREILVSGLREFLAGVKLRVPVSRLAKWKTAIQMVAIGFLVVGEAGPSFLPTLTIGEIGLWVAAGLTLVTGYDYLLAGLRHMSGEAPASAKPPVKGVEPVRPAG
ncbi:MAG: CDP-diacylglycerol--glycerol-3-phosphate 3-phosphatidyltransferase [Alphaproteobacteria bacterium]|nr:CDP-diacylglycerol--glycerol-3-phosphate 3-phosphatidyltransferase [Alphaproteobacteria bacterium]